MNECGSKILRGPYSFISMREGSLRKVFTISYVSSSNSSGG